MYKLTENGYVLAVSTTAIDGIEITETEYNDILSALRNRPQPKDGFSLMLKDGTLEWEYMPAEPKPLTEEEAITRYANSVTGASDPDLISAAETLIEQRIKEEE